jgi:hypothetical protein
MRNDPRRRDPRSDESFKTSKADSIRPPYSRLKDNEADAECRCRLQIHCKLQDSHVVPKTMHFSKAGWKLRKDSFQFIRSSSAFVGVVTQDARRPASKTQKALVVLGSQSNTTSINRCKHEYIWTGCNQGQQREFLSYNQVVLGGEQCRHGVEQEIQNGHFGGTQ